MPEKAPRFDAHSVREQWDYAAEAYDRRQSTGGDYYRYDFFGPAQVALCGDVGGLTLLDLGCGAGYFSREMARRGATVTGIDISPAQIQRALRHEAEVPLGLTYLVLDASEASGRLGPDSFDLITSCVALQDMPEPETVIRGAYALLKPGARFVASITHPCTDTPYRAWERDAEGNKLALKINHYFDRGPVAFTWPTQQDTYEFTTTGLHTTLSEWLNWFIGAGFVLRRIEEPRPTAQALAAHPDLEDADRLPYFLFIDAAKPA
jgi:2-polyprenyl-3-methyl-5-hydroxy-6-metoxy-1,4-benzoquinol methylase